MPARPRRVPRREGHRRTGTARRREPAGGARGAGAGGRDGAPADAGRAEGGGAARGDRGRRRASPTRRRHPLLGAREGAGRAALACEPSACEPSARELGAASDQVEMVRHARGVAAHLRAEKADVCIPRRDDAMFRRTYPIEQYHSERFANAHLDALARPHGLPAGIDWTFGPVALRAALAPCWLRCDGELWDAQVRFRPTSAQPRRLARAH